MKRIYMDHAATTPLDPEVLEAMRPFFSQKYGNASSLHSFGREAKQALEKARSAVADLMKAEQSEIVFTSGGTEADNLALKGAVRPGEHIVTSRIEHHAILNTCKFLESRGVEVTYLPVDRYGTVSPGSVEKAIRKNTRIVSVMHANNEIGTIEPVKEIAKVCKKHGVLFHTDAVQTFGKMPIDVKSMGVDMLSVSSHKLYGPKGVGCLYVRGGIKLKPIIHGGEHEGGVRSGTENIPGAVGFAKACELAKKNMLKEGKRLSALRDKLVKGVLKIPDAGLNGHPSKRVPGNANFSFSFIEGESLILRLDEKGIAASTGSACSTKELTPSHVLTAICLKPMEAHGSLRLSLGKQNTQGDVKYLLEVLPGVVEELRAISPFKGRGGRF